MQRRYGERHVPCPVMDAKVVEAMVRPVRPRVVPHGKQQAEQEVERQESDGDETGVARKIDGAYASMDV